MKYTLLINYIHLTNKFFLRSVVLYFYAYFILATIRYIFTVFFTREQVKADAKHLSFLIFLSIDMDDDTEEDLSRASTPAPAEATEDSAASANIDSLPASAEGIPTHASCERPSQESTTQGNW